MSKASTKTCPKNSRQNTLNHIKQNRGRKKLLKKEKERREAEEKVNKVVWTLAKFSM